MFYSSDNSSELPRCAGVFTSPITLVKGQNTAVRHSVFNLNKLKRLQGRNDSFGPPERVTLQMFSRLCHTVDEKMTTS